jgi:hypothetical protein
MHSWLLFICPEHIKKTTYIDVMHDKGERKKRERQDEKEKE